jgi:electron transfer flavoprotein alpha subunit
MAEQQNTIWVIAEVHGGEVQPVTHELLGLARKLADARSTETWCLVLGDGVGQAAEQLYAYGADAVLVADDSRLGRFEEETQAAFVSRLVSAYKPETILAAATTRGRALVPRIAVLCNTGMSADCIAVDVNAETGNLTVTRSVLGGTRLAELTCTEHRPQIATVRPRVMDAPAPDGSRSGRRIDEALQESDVCTVKRVVEVLEDTQKAIQIADAEFIVAGGRGVGGPEGFDVLRQLAEKVGGAVGASRAAVDAGWIAYQHQVGQTGKTVRPKVYMACGISGQTQHLAGMRNSDLIIAINKTKDAPIMDVADIAIVGDLFQVLPQIVEQLPTT